MPADAWPAPEVVTAYYGRNSEENRFAQEDRELGLDRLISYRLPGQELATLVGLSVWNLGVVQGFELDRPPAGASRGASPSGPPRPHRGTAPMSADSSRIVNKLWSYCNVLRDDGLSYGDYLLLPDAVHPQMS